MKNLIPIDKVADASEKRRARILSSGVFGVGEIKDITGTKQRTPNGDYLWRIKMAVRLDGRPRKIISAILEPTAVRTILTYLKLPEKPPELAPAHIPEQEEFA